MAQSIAPPLSKSAKHCIEQTHKAHHVGSALRRKSQKLSFIRNQRNNTPEDVHMLRHAIQKRLSRLHLKRIKYTNIFEQPQNGYGPTNRELLCKRVSQGGNLAWLGSNKASCMHI